MSLLYVNRTSRSAMLLDELQDVRDRHLGRLSIAFAFTREVTAGDLLSGRPDRERVERWIAAGLLPADADHAFLCGPLELTTDAREALIEAGIPAEHVHREVFTTKQQGTATSRRRRSPRSPSPWRPAERHSTAGHRRSSCTRATACSMRFSGYAPTPLLVP